MEVRQMGERQLRLSVRRLSEEFGMARETVMRRLQLANAKQAAVVNGHPVFTIRVAAEALLSPVARGEDGEIDPRTLPPSDRNMWFQSENRRVELEMRCQQLIPAAEVEAKLAFVVSACVQFGVTLPDQLERDLGLTPEQVEAVSALVDRQRLALYAMLNAPEGEDVRERA